MMSRQVSLSWHDQINRWLDARSCLPVAAGGTADVVPGIVRGQSHLEVDFRSLCQATASFVASC